LDTAKLLLAVYPEGATVQNSDGNSPLQIAIKRENLDATKLLLDSCPDSAKAQNNEESLPLHIACRIKSLHIAELLLNAYPEGSKVRNKNGQIPLHCACRNNDTEMAILLLKTHSEGAKVKDNNGRLPVLHSLIFCGSSGFIKMLFKAYPEAVREKTNEGNLPLHVACKMHTADIDDIVQFLIEAYPEGAKVQNLAGFLPLHFAVDRNAFNAAKWLLKVYPEASIVKNQAGYSPLILLCNDYFISKFELEWLDLFLSANPGSMDIRDQRGDLPSDILRSAASTLDVTYQEDDLPSFTDSLRDLLRSYHSNATNQVYHTNATNQAYKFLLHNAIKRGLSKHAVKLLLQAFPASCSVRDEKGMAPLHYACSSTTSNFLDNVVLLLEFDADSLIIENRGRTPLQYLSADKFAVLKSDVFFVHHLAAHSLKISGESLRLLFHYFPKSISTPDKRGMLPFHYAVLNSASTVEVLMLFLSESPDVLCSIQPYS